MKTSTSNSSSNYTRPIIRCAIYTRKSTEEGLQMDFNSLDAQREAAENYIRSQLHEGWTLVQDRYDDGAYSGGNMERPALKRLMDDIKARKIQMVVVYKIDRLSRSLMDFATLARFFEGYGASFTSVTEQFSTGNAIGRLHLNMILSFAQFEREIASERIRDKVLASKKKGMWMGGYAPLGYDIVERKLVIDPKSAEVVRWVFKRYLECQSLVTIAQELRLKGIQSKGYTSKRGKVWDSKPFGTTVIHHMLRNPVYVGKVHHKGNLYDGQHQPLVSQELWDSVQSAFGIAPKRPPGREVADTTSALSGIVSCKCCKCTMIHTFTRKKGRLYRYFTSSAVRRGVSDTCSVGTVSAPSLEEMVLGQIRAILRQPEVISDVWQQVQLLGHLMSEEDIRRRLLRLDQIWGELFPAEQREFIRLLVHRVEMSPDGATIHMHSSGLESLLRQLVEVNREDMEGNADLYIEDTDEAAADGWTGAHASPHRAAIGAR